jgi:hypothetical protein
MRTALFAGAIVAAIACGPVFGTPAPVLMTQAFVLHGTDIGDVPTDEVYLGFADSIIDGVNPALNTGPLNLADIVDYPGSFWPVSGGGFADPTFDNSVGAGGANLHAAVVGSEAESILIFGYSQGAVVATRFKSANPDPATPVTYVLGSNPNRPNGGILGRFAGLTVPILGISASGATPTAGGVTYDVARQYEGWADFPRYPLNVVSTINAVLGIAYLHGVNKQIDQVDFADLDDPAKTDIVADGETTYYTVPTARLPLLIPLEFIVPSPILTALDAPLRVIVEWGYDRGVNPGTPTTAALIRWGNPVQDLVNLALAIPTGIDDGLAEAAGNPAYRPLGTAAAGMYGVGGRPQSPVPVPSAGAKSAATVSITARSNRAAVVSPAARHNGARPAKPTQDHPGRANARAR